MKDKKQLIKEGVLSPFEDPNFIPPYLNYLGHKYKFSCNKGGLLCYTFTPKSYDNCDGSTIIVEHKKNKRWIDRFYVLLFIYGCSAFDNGYTSVANINGYSRQATPSLDELTVFGR